MQYLIVVFGLFNSFKLISGYYNYTIKAAVDFSPDLRFTDLVYYTDKVPWNSARKECQSKGGDLAKVDSQEMMRDIVAMAYLYLNENEIFPEDFWLGLVQPEENLYVWVSDCTELNYKTFVRTGWDTDKQCIRLHKSELYGESVSCRDSRSFICQIPRNEHCPLVPRLEAGVETANRMLPLNMSGCDAACDFDCIGTVWTNDNTCMLLSPQTPATPNIKLKTKYCFNVSKSEASVPDDNDDTSPLHNCSINPTISPTPTVVFTSSGSMTVSSTSDCIVTTTIMTTATATVTLTTALVTLNHFSTLTEKINVTEILTVTQNLTAYVTDITTLLSTVTVLPSLPQLTVTTCLSQLLPGISNMTESEAEEVAEEIVKNLTVEAKTTSAYKRSKISAEDHRASAKTMGFLVTVFVVVPLVILIAADLKKIFADLTWYGNIFKR